MPRAQPIHNINERNAKPEERSPVPSLRKAFFVFSFGSAFLVCLIVFREVLHLHPESVLHFLGMRSASEKAVILELNQFPRVAKLVANYSVDVLHQFPPTVLDEYFLMAFPGKGDVFGKNNHRTFYYLERGVDPWGSKFVFNSTLRNRGAGRYTLFLTVRCVGSNGKDENGQGDDMQRIVEYPFFLEDVSKLP